MPGPRAAWRWPSLPNVEPFHHDARALPARVGVLQLGPDGAVFTRHQGDVVVAVDGGQYPVAALFAHGLDAHHEGRLIACIAQFGRNQPAAALPLRLAGGFHLDLGDSANGFEVVAERATTLAAGAARSTGRASRGRRLFQAAQIESVTCLLY